MLIVAWNEGAMSHNTAAGRNVLIITLLLFFIVSCPSMSQQTTTSSPSSSQIAEGKPTSRSPRSELHSPPRLEGSAESARKSVQAFLAWAGASTLEEEEDGRRVIERAQANPEIAKGLIEEFHTARQKDFSRALVVLAVLGELRNPAGEQFLLDLVHQPCPKRGLQREKEK